MRILVYDDDKGIENEYWVYLEGISLDFDSSWTPGSEVRIYRKDGFDGDEAHLYSIHDCPRSLAWDTSTPLNCLWNTLCVDYKGCDGGPSRTCVIAECGEVHDLALDVEYQCGVAQLEIKLELGFGTSTVRLMVRKTSEYYGAECFKLSVVIENINRDEWNKLLEYQQQTLFRADPFVDDVPVPWRGSECVIEQMPKSPWQDDRSDVTNDIRHVAHESMALVLNHYVAQSGAIERGLSYDDFLWEFPNHRETRVVRRPSAQTDIPLRALRLDISIQSGIYNPTPVASLYIGSIELNLISITRSPSLANNLSSCTLHLDPPYATLANATIPNHWSQIIEIPTGSKPAERVITTSGPIHVNGPLQIMGDMFAAPIYGGNVGGQNNTNHFTAPLTVEAVASAVLRAFDSRQCDGGRFVPQTEAGRKRKRDDGEDIERPSPSKRQFRSMSFISRFCAALFSP